MSALPDTVLNLLDLDAHAEARLPRPIWAYVSGGVEDGVSLRANRAAFERLHLVPRLLRDVSQRSAAITLLGQRFAQPFGIAPMGLAALSGFEADLAMARAAQAAGVPFILSGSSLVPMEEVFAAAPSSWFQAYLPGQPERINALLDRVARAGFRHLVITVDLPVPANRENLTRAGFSIPLKPSLDLALDGLRRPGWLVGTLLQTLLRRGMPHFENLLAERRPSNARSRLGLSGMLKPARVRFSRLAGTGRSTVMTRCLKPARATRSSSALMRSGWPGR
jgi:L-lactate dehydrogenase (cytochrome)